MFRGLKKHQIVFALIILFSMPILSCYLLCYFNARIKTAYLSQFLNILDVWIRVSIHNFFRFQEVSPLKALEAGLVRFVPETRKIEIWQRIENYDRISSVGGRCV